MATETTLRPGELKEILLREIASADLGTEDVSEVGAGEIAAAAGAWLAAHPEDAESNIRFDAVLVAPGKIPRHIPAAFETD